VRELLRVGVRETIASRPGGTATLAKLAEILFGEALRRYADGLAGDARGFLAGLRDPHVGRALALIHGEPGMRWTVEELARRAALSRSALAARFASLVGETPMQYLTRWRLALAARDLRAGREAIVRVAERSGYESEAAFNRAFKREFGLPPAMWRRAAAA
jgi:AraC-like DNA-binding protein